MPSAQENKRLLVLDYGSDYTQQLVGCLVALGVSSVTREHTVSAADIRDLAPAGVILVGGPASVFAQNAPRLDPDLLGLDVPLLGVCLGMQLLALAVGGRIDADAEHAGLFGRARLTPRSRGRLLGRADLGAVWMSHRDPVTAMPDGFVVTASADGSPVAAFEDPDRGLYGTLFHPGFPGTPRAAVALRRFAGEICGVDVGSRWSCYRRLRARKSAGPDDPAPPAPSIEPWTSLHLERARHCTNARNGAAWTHTAARTGDVPLTFTGWHVGYAESVDAAHDFVGVLVNVWVTTTGKVVTSTVSRAKRGQAAAYAAAVHDDPHSARRWLGDVAQLGHGNAGMGAWAMACRVVGDFSDLAAERV